MRTVGGGRAHQAHHEPGVVDLRVPVLDRPDVAVGAERGHEPPGLTTGQVTVSRDARTARCDRGEHVVEPDAGTDVGPFPSVVGQRVEERHRAYQVRRELGEQQAALGQRLPDQPEVEHLQVAQAAVDQLARAAGGAPAPVPHVDQADIEPAGDGVQRRAGADHAATDHQQVEFVRGERRDRRRALGRAQPSGSHGTSVCSRRTENAPVERPVAGRFLCCGT